MKNKHKYIINFTLIILTLILLILLGLGFHKDFLLKQKDNEDYIEWSKSNSFYSSNNCFYNMYSSFKEKIKNKEEIKILILSDNFILKDNSWTEKISKWFESRYGNNINLIYINADSNNILDGITLLDNSQTLDFDLAIISFGLYDSINNSPVDTFGQSYTNLICSLKSKNYNSSIISIIPPVINQNSEYVSTIKSLCSSNNIGFIAPFFESNNKSDAFYSDTSPTEKEYNYLTKCFENLILQELE